MKSDNLYREQKRKVADQQCRHLKGYAHQTIINYELDETDIYPVCNQCGKLLSGEEIITINKIIKKYEQNN